MRETVSVDQLKVDKVLYDFVNDEAIPGSGVQAGAFWKDFAALVVALAPRNAALLRRRDELQAKIDELRYVHEDSAVDISDEINRLQKKSQQLTKEIYSKLTAWQIAQVARHPQRPYTLDYINGMFADFRELHGDLLVELRYRSAPAVDAAGDEVGIQAALLAELRAQRALDERRRFTGTGPHTDDLEIVLAGRLAREHASQGQLRSLVLALKLAELTNVEARRDDVPVLLLDDVPSELDRTRRKFLFDMVGGLSCQTLISVTEREVVSPLTDRVDFQVTRGQVLP